jgi:hypothetical protein
MSHSMSHPMSHTAEWVHHDATTGRRGRRRPVCWSSSLRRGGLGWADCDRVRPPGRLGGGMARVSGKGWCCALEESGTLWNIGVRQVTREGDGVFTCQRAARCCGEKPKAESRKQKETLGQEHRRKGAVSLPIQGESRFLRQNPVQQGGESAVSNGKWRIGGEESEGIAVSGGALFANTCAAVDMTQHYSTLD